MEAINERVIHIINSLGVTRTEFANKLHVTPSAVTKFCKGEIALSDRTIADICRKYNVSEAWLRTGEGEMKQKLTRNQEIAEFMGVVMHDPDDSPRKRFVSIISKLSVDEWQLLAEIAKKMAEDG